MPMKNRKDFVASLARGIEIIRAFTREQAEDQSTASPRVGPADALTLSQWPKGQASPEP